MVRSGPSMSQHHRQLGLGTYCPRQIPPLPTQKVEATTHLRVTGQIPSTYMADVQPKVAFPIYGPSTSLHEAGPNWLQHQGLAEADHPSRSLVVGCTERTVSTAKRSRVGQLTSTNLDQILGHQVHTHLTAKMGPNQEASVVCLLSSLRADLRW